MNFSKFNKQELLFRGGIMINNSLGDQVVLDAVTPMGYDAVKLQEGKALLLDSETLYESQLKEYGDVDEAQNQYKSKRAQGEAKYKMMLNLARIAFKDDVKATTTLQLNGRRAGTVSGWLKQTRNFYRAILANEEWKASMATLGQTEEILTTALQDVDQINELQETINREQGDAQNATQVRDMKFEELIDWLADYETVARIALADKPQLLEKLGIVVPS